MTSYNKLIRDNIPELIKKSKKEVLIRTLEEDEYKTEVKKKLGEELEEYKEAATNEEAVEELADILELLHAAVKIHGSSIEELEQVRQAKAEMRGGFDKRIFLIEVEDD